MSVCVSLCVFVLCPLQISFFAKSILNREESIFLLQFCVRFVCDRCTFLCLLGVRIVLEKLFMK